MLEGFYYYKLLLESALVGAVRCRHMFPGACSGWGAAGLSSEMESRSAMVARMFHEGDTMCVRLCGGVVLRKWSPAWRRLLECFTRAPHQREKGAPVPGPGAGAGAAETGREAAGASGTGARSSLCGNQPVFRVHRQFFTKSFLGDGVAALAPSSGEEPTWPRHRAGVASMA